MASFFNFNIPKSRPKPGPGSAGGTTPGSGRPHRPPQGGRGPGNGGRNIGDKEFAELISAAMPFMRRPEQDVNLFDRGLGVRGPSENQLRNKARRSTADELHKQVQFLMGEGGMSHGLARDALERFYQRAGNYKAIGAGPGRMGTGKVLRQLMGDQGLGKGVVSSAQQKRQQDKQFGGMTPDEYYKGLQEQVIQPYLQTRYAQDMDFADQYEQSMYDKVGRIKDPVRQEIAAVAVSNMAQLMRFDAQNSLTEFQSPYGAQGTFGYIMGRQNAGMKSMLQNLNPYASQSATGYDPYGTNGVDFASQVLGQQMMPTTSINPAFMDPTMYQAGQTADDYFG